jgi:hypothetical protein
MLTVGCFCQLDGFGDLVLSRSNWSAADPDSASATGLRVSSLLLIDWVEDVHMAIGHSKA